MDKGKARADDEGLIEVKRKKSGDYPDNSDSDDEVEHVENETASFLASKGVGCGPKNPWEQWIDIAVDGEYDPWEHEEKFVAIAYLKTNL
ncbi:hypothetical protein Tco_1335236 [Tanacetum coccineum]